MCGLKCYAEYLYVFLEAESFVVRMSIFFATMRSIYILRSKNCQTFLKNLSTLRIHIIFGEY